MQIIDENAVRGGDIQVIGRAVHHQQVAHRQIIERRAGYVHPLRGGGHEEVQAVRGAKQIAVLWIGWQLRQGQQPARQLVIQASGEALPADALVGRTEDAVASGRDDMPGRPAVHHQVAEPAHIELRRCGTRPAGAAVGADDDSAAAALTHAAHPYRAPGRLHRRDHFDVVQAKEWAGLMHKGIPGVAAQVRPITAGRVQALVLRVCRQRPQVEAIRQLIPGRAAVAGAPHGRGVAARVAGIALAGVERVSKGAADGMFSQRYAGL